MPQPRLSLRLMSISKPIMEEFKNLSLLQERKLQKFLFKFYTKKRVDQNYNFLGKNFEVYTYFDKKLLWGREAVKCPKFKNILRTYPRLGKGEEPFILDTARNHGNNLFLFTDIIVSLQLC